MILDHHIILSRTNCPIFTCEKQSIIEDQFENISDIRKKRLDRFGSSKR